MKMSNLKTLLLILSLLLVPVVLSEPEAVQHLLRRLDSNRAPASLQEAAAQALLSRLLPTHVSSFVFKIVPVVLFFLRKFILFLRKNYKFLCVGFSFSFFLVLLD